MGPAGLGLRTPEARLLAGDTELPSEVVDPPAAAAALPQAAAAAPVAKAEPALQGQAGFSPYASVGTVTPPSAPPLHTTEAAPGEWGLPLLAAAIALAVTASFLRRLAD